MGNALQLPEPITQFTAAYMRHLVTMDELIDVAIIGSENGLSPVRR